MGNATSCAPVVFSGPVKVLRGNGTLEVYTRPINAGYLMLENPRQFVCDSIDLKVGHRIPGLTADEELEPGRLYFLLPMEMLYSVLTAQILVSLTHKVSKAMKQRGSTNLGRMGRVFPSFGGSSTFPCQVKPLTETGGPLDTKVRIPRQGSWRPALDTIIENCSCFDEDV